MQEEVKALTGLITGSETVKDQVAAQIQEHQHELEEERHSRNEVMEAASECNEKRGFATVEVDALQQKLLAVDQQRDELQAVADECAEEIDSMKTESESLQDAMSEMQSQIHILRQTIAVQNDQMKDRDTMLASQHEIQQQIESGITALDGKPFSVGPGETNFILQDLSNMTRENQLLHGELRVMKQKTDNIQSATNEQSLQQQQMMRSLGASRLEKDDVLQRY